MACGCMGVRVSIGVSYVSWRAMRREGRSIISKNDHTDGPRIGASSYLNTAPLIWSFVRGSRAREVQLTMDAAPARCADLLARGSVEAALVPVIEYQRLPEVVLVSDACVGARTKVRSVVLVTRCAELREVQTIALDESSRTSAVLVQIIFREFLGR